MVLSTLTLPNDSFLPSPHRWEKIQDPHRIRKTALSALEQLLESFPDVQHIGVTGQMHGIVYLNKQGIPVSPLYTWQDGRGDLIATNKETYAELLHRITGYSVSTGYGLVTHYYQQQNHLVSPEAVCFCTIHDYIAMLLAEMDTPVIDPTDAASLGLFDVEHGCFDFQALQAVGINPSMLPVLSNNRQIGRYRGTIPVYTAIGDNQASFLGATGGETNAMLVNIGTGSQFSIYSHDYITCPGLETRPFPGGGYLLVGASLCGGRAYALLESFFRATAEMAGNRVDSCYDAMAQLLEGEMPADLPIVSPLFQGTRQDPLLRGSITGLSTENFTPRHLIWATLTGMASELAEMAGNFRHSRSEHSSLIGSGNGLRKNPFLQQAVANAFERSLTMSPYTEEAACGAALFALQSCRTDN